MQRLACIFWLGLKEMMSLRRDWVMVALLIWSFTLAPVMEATGVASSVNNASIAFADEDNSPLSRALAQAFFPPEFQPVVQIDPGTGAAMMDAGEFLFIVAVPPGFEKDLRAGRVPEIQVQIDATAMEQAGIGANYITSILGAEIRRFAIGADLMEPSPVTVSVRSAFNPNRDTVRFAGIVALIGQIMWLTTILTGAAMIREREHGTIEHLLAMPLTPFDIAMAKNLGQCGGGSRRRRALAHLRDARARSGSPSPDQRRSSFWGQHSFSSPQRRSVCSSRPSRAPWRSSRFS